jgi:hypothetical protein
LFERKRADKFRKIYDRLRESSAHLTGEEADAAERAATFDLWAEEMRAVEGYDDVAGKSREEVVAFFRGETFNGDMSEEEKADAREVLWLHVKTAFQGFLNAHVPDYSFRRNS